MSAFVMSEEFILVIDTNFPSVHFASKLVAYCTGYVNELEVNNDLEFADLFYRDFSIEDDEGKSGKLAIEKNPFYNSIETKFLPSPTSEYDEDSFQLPPEIATPWCVMLNPKFGCDEDGNYDLLNEQNYNVFVEPAPLSVGIFFAIKPSDELIGIIKKRSKDFFESVYNKSEPNKNISAEGFRLISYIKTAEETVL